MLISSFSILTSVICLPVYESPFWLVQRNLKIAETLKAEAETKRAEAVRLAREWEEAKRAAQEAAQVIEAPSHNFSGHGMQILAFHQASWQCKCISTVQSLACCASQILQ